MTPFDSPSLYFGGAAGRPDCGAGSWPSGWGRADLVL